jgi:hypothetical protein
MHARTAAALAKMPATWQQVKDFCPLEYLMQPSYRKHCDHLQIRPLALQVVQAHLEQ